MRRRLTPCCATCRLAFRPAGRRPDAGGVTHVVDAPGLRAALAAQRPVRLLDVRWRLDQPEGRPAYLAAHLPGAVYVDLERELSRVGHPEDGRYPLPAPAALERAARGWGLDDGDLVVAYDDNDGVAASRAWWLLRRHGVDVRVLDGGIRAWVGQGLPVESGDRVAPTGRVRLRATDAPDDGVATIDDAARAARGHPDRRARAGSLSRSADVDGGCRGGGCRRARCGGRGLGSPARQGVGHGCSSSQEAWAAVCADCPKVEMRTGRGKPRSSRRVMRRSAASQTATGRPRAGSSGPRAPSL